MFFKVFFLVGLAILLMSANVSAEEYDEKLSPKRKLKPKWVPPAERDVYSSPPCHRQKQA